MARGRIMRLTRALMALSAVFLVFDAAAEDSAYTRLDLGACDVLDAAPPGGPGAWTRLRCNGLGGNAVHVVEDDARMSLDYGPVAGPGRWESFAGFNRVHDVVEWRLDDGGTPFATIHRWFVSRGDGTERQVLVVSTVASRADPRSCVVGLVDAAGGGSPNRRARRVADRVARGFRCGVDEARTFGPTGSSPMPRFSPASAQSPPNVAPGALARCFLSAAATATRPRIDGPNSA